MSGQKGCRNLQFWLGALTFTFSTLIVTPTQAQLSLEKQLEIQKQSNILPMELLVAGNSGNIPVLVRAKQQEMGERKDWLLPLDTVAQALNLQVIPRPENQELELRSPAKNIILARSNLEVDPDLGTVVSLEKLQEILKVESQVNQVENTINLIPRWLAFRQQNLRATTVKLERTPDLNVEIDLINSQSNLTPLSDLNYSHNLTAMGSAFGGKWHIRTYQGDLLDQRSLHLREGQYLYQTENSDYIIGLQPRSLLNQGSGQFFGLTTIQRWGFAPNNTNQRNFNYFDRLQPSKIGRRITGKTEPGIVVHLVKPGEKEAIATTQADENGDYRFDSVPAPQGKITQYQLLFYSEAEATEPQAVKKVVLTTMAEQMPAGASILILSGGTAHEMSPDAGFLGKMGDWEGGVSYSLGVTEDLTMGIKAGYNQVFDGLGELLYQPAEFPVQIHLSLRNSQDPNHEGWQLNSKIKYQPLSNLSLDFSSDRLQYKMALNWEAFPGFNIWLQGNQVQQKWRTNLRLGYENEYLAAIATAELNGDQELSWSITSRLGQLQLAYQDQPHRKQAELSYNFSNLANVGQGHWVFLNHQYYQHLESFEQMTIVGWRYRSSTEETSGGFWEFSLGYGFASTGNGVTLSLARQLVPGLRLQLDYKTLSLNQNDSAIQLKIVPNFDIFSGSREWEF